MRFSSRLNEDAETESKTWLGKKQAPSFSQVDSYLIQPKAEARTGRISRDPSFRASNHPDPTNTISKKTSGAPVYGGHGGPDKSFYLQVAATIFTFFTVRVGVAPAADDAAAPAELAKVPVTFTSCPT